MICVNLNDGQFQAIMNVALNGTTRKVPLSNDCVGPGLGTTYDWSPITVSLDGCLGAAIAGRVIS